MLFIDGQHPTELLQAIPVQNSSQISELVSRRDVQSLPNHPFLQFAIPEHDKGMKLLTAHPGTQSEAQADRQPLPERPRRGIQAWKSRYIRMPLESGFTLIKGFEFLRGGQS